MIVGKDIARRQRTRKDMVLRFHVDVIDGSVRFQGSKPLLSHK